DLKVFPQKGSIATEFSFDISGSIDEQTPTENLLVRWDFNGDGIFDTDYLNQLTVQHQFETVSEMPVICWVFDEHFAIAKKEFKIPSLILNHTRLYIHFLPLVSQIFQYKIPSIFNGMVEIQTVMIILHILFT
ncbi:MAG: hypothetical protein OMM_11279, partial [Candidatus Magnetoglobus multicellularis str. Araruama]